jgi:hypothetical protein
MAVLEKEVLLVLRVQKVPEALRERMEIWELKDFEYVFVC